ncbi:hypothetical protein QBC34DRAFT_457369 [Podospora aff. communis PSN243]|uniref:Caspase domain-containing protein n=1 Tax=Podospora aff. communis PSN243 TaxID=3040156 RepID=A0AAV9G438_9PEZI|nr:hypothetical protein QBC34DRAFT_457369 [Podospora aff. communis PSN243]
MQQFRCDESPWLAEHRNSLHVVFGLNGSLWHSVVRDRFLAQGELAISEPAAIVLPESHKKAHGGASLVSVKDGPLYMFYRNSHKKIVGLKYVHDDGWSAGVALPPIYSRSRPSVCCGPGDVVYMLYVDMLGRMMIRFSNDGCLTWSTDMPCSLPAGVSRDPESAPALCCTPDGIFVAYATPAPESKVYMTCWSKSQVVESKTSKPLSSSLSVGEEINLTRVRGSNRIIAAWYDANQGPATATIDPTNQAGFGWNAPAAIAGVNNNTDAAGSHPHLCSIGSILVAGWRWASDGTFGLAFSADEGATWSSNTARARTPDPRLWLRRNVGLAMAGDFIVAIDAKSQAWQLDLAKPPGEQAWVALPPVEGGIDCVAGARFEMGEYRFCYFFVLSKKDPSHYWYRNPKAGEKDPPWLAGVHDFADSPHVWVYDLRGGLWRADASNSRPAWSRSPWVSVDEPLGVVSMAAMDTKIVFGLYDGSLCLLDTEGGTIRQLPPCQGNATVWREQGVSLALPLLILGGMAALSVITSVGLVVWGAPPAKPVIHPHIDPRPRPPVSESTRRALLIQCFEHRSKDIDEVDYLIQHHFSFDEKDIVKLDNRFMLVPDFESEPPERVAKAMEKAPTKKNVIAAITDLLQGTGPGDVRFLYFHGHGARADDIDGDELPQGNPLKQRDSYFKLLPGGGGNLLDDELAQLIVKHCHARCNLTLLSTICHGGTLLDNQYRGQPGVVGPKRGISLAPVHDNQHARGTTTIADWTWAFRAAVRVLADESGGNKLPNLLVSYRRLFNLMREKMYYLGTVSTGRGSVSLPSADPTKPEDDKQDPLMMYDPAWIDPDTHEFLEPFIQ